MIQGWFFPWFWRIILFFYSGKSKLNRSGSATLEATIKLVLRICRGYYKFCHKKLAIVFFLCNFYLQCSLHHWMTIITPSSNKTLGLRKEQGSCLSHQQLQQLRRKQQEYPLLYKGTKWPVLHDWVFFFLVPLKKSVVQCTLYRSIHWKSNVLQGTRKTAMFIWRGCTGWVQLSQMHLNQKVIIICSTLSQSYLYAAYGLFVVYTV